MLDVVHTVLPLVLGLVDEVPESEDVKAGSIAFIIFVAGFVAVALLGWSLVRHLRKVEDARKRGVFGDAPEDPEDSEPTAPDADTRSTD